MSCQIRICCAALSNKAAVAGSSLEKIEMNLKNLHNYLCLDNNLGRKILYEFIKKRKKMVQNICTNK